MDHCCSSKSPQARQRWRRGIEHRDARRQKNTIEANRHCPKDGKLSGGAGEKQWRRIMLAMVKEVCPELKTRQTYVQRIEQTPRRKLKKILNARFRHETPTAEENGV
jgi:hypothetical protein